MIGGVISIVITTMECILLLDTITSQYYNHRTLMCWHKVQRLRHCLCSTTSHPHSPKLLCGWTPFSLHRPAKQTLCATATQVLLIFLIPDNFITCQSDDVITALYVYNGTLLRLWTAFVWKHPRQHARYFLLPEHQQQSWLR